MSVLTEIKEKIPAKPFLAAMIGGALELYDFTLFGFLSPLFSPLFFPTEDKFSAILLGYSTFAVGYVCKPIGAIIFGHIGDRLGRRASLSLSLWFMGLSTLLIGLLPPYAAIGIAAPLLMVLARIFQGLSAGGEVTGGFIYSLEHVEPSVHGLAGGILNAGVSSGIFLGSLAGFLCALPSMPSWAWRVPFLLGFIVVLFGSYLRRHVPESPVFAHIKKDAIEEAPLLHGVKKEYKKFFLQMFIVGFPGIAFHINFIYLPTFFASLPHVSDSFSRFCGAASTLCLVFLLPITGFYSGRIKQASLMKAGALLIALFSFAFFHHLHQLSLTGILMHQVSMAVFLSLFNGPFCAFEMKIFQAEHRCSCIGVGYNIAAALFGGTAPLLGMMLTRLPQGHLLLAGYLCLWGVIGFLAVWALDNLYQRASESRGAKL